MPLNFKFPERPLTNKDDLLQQPGPKKDKTKKNKANKKAPVNNNIVQAKTTSPPSKFINEHMIVEQFEIEETTTVESVLDRPSLPIAPGSSVSAEKLPSIYLGHVLFTDHRLLLPLFNGSTSKSIGESWSLGLQLVTMVTMDIVSFTEKDPYALLMVYFTGLEQILPNHNRTL